MTMQYTKNLVTNSNYHASMCRELEALSLLDDPLVPA